MVALVVVDVCDEVAVLEGLLLLLADDEEEEEEEEEESDVRVVLLLELAVVDGKPVVVVVDCDVFR